MANPIPCFIAGNKGYVWDANGAMRLRKQHRIMGCLVGSVAQFKNQNEVNYLPLELSADEVTLAVRQGWIELLPETSAPVRAAAAAAAAAAASRAAAAAAAGSYGRGPDGDRRPPLASDSDWEAAYLEYYSQFDPRVGFTGRYLPVLGAKRRQLSYHPGQSTKRDGGSDAEQQPATAGADGATAAAAAATAAGAHDHEPDGARRQRCGGAGGAAAAAPAESAADQSEPGWRTAVTDGGSYTLPLTAAAAAAARVGSATTAAAAAASGRETGTGGGGGGGAVRGPAETEAAITASGTAAAEAEAATAAGLSPSSNGGVGRVGWSYPSTREERVRFAVFADLHRQGFMMTGGIKFGSDLLAYPGDPSLYHAQFTVRPVAGGGEAAGHHHQQGEEEGEEEAINPMVLKAVARGSHAARKHLLLASCKAHPSAGETEPRIKYMSFAPESGFGSKA